MTTLTLQKDPQAAAAEQVLIALLSLMRKLKSIYAGEVEALTRNDTQAFLSLQSDKMALSRDYELRVKEIQARGAAIKASDPALRQQIISEQSELHALADKSQSAALRMAEAMRRLQDRLIDAARQSVAQEKLQYTHRGSMNGPESGKPVATAINEDI